jgi:serine protease inhibitor
MGELFMTPLSTGKRSVLLTAALVLGATVAACAAPNMRSKPMVASASNAFGIDLLGKLVKAAPDGNCFISPYSVQQALLLADNGAAGATKSQIGAVLHLGATSLSDVNAQSKAMRESLAAADPKVKISVANALWADRSFAFKPTYQETCREFYDALTQTVALHQPSGVAAINVWVAQKTEGKIKNIVSSDNLVQAKAVLTNAVYFHGVWTTPFPRASTYPQDFHTTPQTVKKIPLMSRQGMIEYAKTSAYEVVALPYGGGRLRMVAVLPAENSSVNGFVKSLTTARWSSLTSSLKPTQLRLFLPRVHVDYHANLVPVLKDLGMRDAFAMNADFSPMDGAKDLYMSAVLHKTTLDIDEDGTTAAAATAVIMRTKGIMMPPPITVRIDRPFYCAIQDTQTGTVLFAGAIHNPG